MQREVADTLLVLHVKIAWVKSVGMLVRTCNWHGNQARHVRSSWWAIKACPASWDTINRAICSNQSNKSNDCEKYTSKSFPRRLLRSRSPRNGHGYRSGNIGQVASSHIHRFTRRVHHHSSCLSGAYDVKFAVDKAVVYDTSIHARGYLPETRNSWNG